MSNTTPTPDNSDQDDREFRDPAKLFNKLENFFDDDGRPKQPDTGGWMSPGASRIVTERSRQVLHHGYTAEHDTGHINELVRAAACYLEWAANELEGVDADVPSPFWPSDWAWKTPSSPEEAIIRGGALAAAMLDAAQGDYLGGN